MRLRHGLIAALRASGATATPWYLSGGVAAANCLIAYQPRGAASYAASKTNLANPGTYDLTDGANYPAWAAASGWTFTSANREYLTIGSGTGPTLKPFTQLARITHDNSEAVRSITGGVNNVIQYRLAADHVQNLTQTYVANIGSSTTPVPNSDKVIGATYSAAGAYVFYLDGSADGNGTADKTVTIDTDIVGACYLTNQYGNGFAGVMAALAIYNIVLTPAQALAVSTAMLALP